MVKKKADPAELPEVGEGESVEDSSSFIDLIDSDSEYTYSYTDDEFGNTKKVKRREEDLCDRKRICIFCCGFCCMLLAAVVILAIFATQEDDDTCFVGFKTDVTKTAAIPASDTHIAGEATVFDIKALGCRGFGFPYGGDRYKGVARLTSDPSISYTIAVKDGDNGKYTATFTPTVVGVYSVDIVLVTDSSPRGNDPSKPDEEKALKDSPYAINVVAAASASGAASSGNSSGTTEQEGTPPSPEVVDVYPAGVVSVANDTSITITFSEALSSVMFELIPAGGNASDVVVSLVSATSVDVEVVGGIAETTYTARVLQATSDQGALLPAVYEWTFTVDNSVGSFSVSIDGVTSAPFTDIDVEGTVNIAFTEAMDQVSVERAFSVLAPSGSIVPGVYSWSQGSTRFSFAPLNTYMDGTIYEVILSDTASDLSGNSLTTPYEGQFTTEDLTPPVVEFTLPPAGEAHVLVSTAVTIGFSEPMSTDRFSVNVTKPDNSHVAGTALWSNGNTWLTLQGAAPLAGLTQYTVTFSGEDRAGLSVMHAFVFTTLDNIAPTVSIDVAGQTSVDVNSPIVVRFSKRMDRTSFVLRVDGSSGPVAGSRAWAQGDSLLTFIPAAPLPYSSTFTVAVPYTAADTASPPNTVAAGTSVTFTTMAMPDTTPPEVLSVSPQGTPMALTLTFTVVLSESVNVSQNINSFRLISQDQQNVAFTTAGEITDTITFTATEEAPERTTFYFEVGPGLQDLAGNVHGQTSVYSFTTVDLTPPTLVSMNPPNGSVNVPLNLSLVLTFSEEVSVTSFTGAVSPVAVGNTVVFDFTLSSYTTVLEQITVQDSSGNVGVPYTYTFVTADVVAPAVVSVEPAHGSTGVDPAQVITVRFSEAMFEADSSLAVSVTSMQMPVPGAISWTDSATLTFTPYDPLASLQFISVEVQSFARDLSGNTLAAPFYSSFTVSDLEPPTGAFVNLEDGFVVPVVTTFGVLFSEPVDAATITTSFTCGSVSLRPTSGLTSKLTITPTAALSSSASCTVSVTAATDANGLALTASFGVAFTVEDIIAPSVVSTSPADDDVDVPVGASIRVEFSEAMSAGSLSSLSVTYMNQELSGERVWERPHILVFTAYNTLPSKALIDCFVHGATDEADNTMSAGFGFTFMTQDIEPPVIKAVKGLTAPVSIQPAISVFFSEEMSTVSMALVGVGSVSSAVVTGTHYDFAPLLNDSSTYTMIIEGADLAGNVARPYVRTFTTVDLTGPNVVSIAPPDGSVHVSSRTNFTIVFSEPINPRSAAQGITVEPAQKKYTDSQAVFVDTSTPSFGFASFSPIPISVKNIGQVRESTGVQGSVSWNADYTVATWSPIPGALKSQQKYTLIVNTQVVDKYSNALREQVVSSFTVADEIRPSVTSYSYLAPVPTTGSIRVFFSESMDSGVTGPAFTISPAVSLDLLWDGTHHSVEIMPTTAYAEQTKYTLTLSTAAADTNGNTLPKESVLVFSTADETGPTVTFLPADNAVGVPLTGGLSITASEQLSLASVARNARVLCGGQAIAGQWLVANPSSWQYVFKGLLVGSSTCVVSLSTQVTDVAGNALAFTNWTFSTIDTTPPKVAGVSPKQSMLSTSNVTISFNENMAASDCITAWYIAFQQDTTVALNVTSTWVSANQLMLSPIVPYVEKSTVYFTLQCQDVAGNSMSAVKVVLAVRDTTAPTLLSSTPTDNAVDVAGSSVLMVFDELMRATAFSGVPTPTGQLWSKSRTQLRVSFPSPLMSFSTYQIMGNATDLAGNTLSVVLQFRSADTSPPSVDVANIVPAAESVLASGATITIPFLDDQGMNQTAAESSFFMYADSSPVAGTFSWTGENMTFTPDAPLPTPSVPITVIVTRSAVDLGKNSLSSAVKLFYVTEDNVAPTVNSTNFDGSASWPPMGVLQVMFDEPMLTVAMEVLLVGGGAASGTFNMSSDRLTASWFPAAAFASTGNYIVAMLSGSTDDASNALVAVNFTFTAADTSNPYIISRAPEANDPNVAVGSSIVVEFSEDMLVLTDHSLVLARSGAAVAYTSSTTATTLTLTPSLLFPETEYMVVIGAGNTDLASNALESSSWKFRTEDTTPPFVVTSTPLPNEHSVPTMTAIVLVFSEPMDNTKTVLLSANGTSYTTTHRWSYDKRWVVVTPNPLPLPEGTEFTIDPTLLTDDSLNGNLLVGAPFTFMTQDMTSPVATITGSIAELTVTFSEAVSPLSGAMSLSSIRQQELYGGVEIVSSTVLIFRPAKLPQTPSATEFILTVKGYADLSGNVMSTVQHSVFSSDTVPPAVQYTNPPLNAEVTATGGTINFVFTEPVVPLTTTFQLTAPIPAPVAFEATQSASNRELFVEPDGALLEGASYSVTLTFRDYAGNTPASPYVFTFTTEAPFQPIMTTVVPAHGSTNAPVKTIVEISLGAPLLVDGADVVDFIVIENVRGEERTLVDGWGWQGNSDGTHLSVFAGWNTQDYGNMYCISFLNYFDITESCFTIADRVAPTVVETSPSPRQAGYAGTTVTVKFSELLSSATIVVVRGPSSCGPRDGTGCTTVSGTTAFVNDTAIWTAAAALASSARFTAFVTAGDTSGIPNQVEFELVFTSLDTTAPTVLSYAPAADQYGVRPKRPVTIEFSEPMNRAVTEAAFSFSPSLLASFEWADDDQIMAVYATDKEPLTAYAWTLTTGAADRTGNKLAVPISETFTTMGRSVMVQCFNITARDAFGNAQSAGGDGFQVSILLSNGDQAQVNYTLTDHGNGIYEVCVVQNTTIAYTIEILSATNETIGKGKDVFFPPPATSARLSQHSGPGLKDALAGSTRIFYIVAMDQYAVPIGQGGDAFSVTVARRNSEDVVNAEVVDEGNGVYTVTYVATDVGSYRINTFLNGVVDHHHIHDVKMLPNPAPAITDAVFGAEFGTIVVTFDVSTNQAGMGSSVDCTRIFAGSTVALLGEDPVCSWTSPSVLTIVFGYRPVVSTSDPLVITASKNLQTAAENSRVYDGAVLARFSVTPLAPVITVAAPRTVAACSALRLDASQTINGLGRPFGPFVWTVDACTGAAACSDVSAIETTLSTANGALVMLSPTSLAGGASYTFSVSVANWAGAVGKASITVEKTAAILNVLIDGPTEFSAHRSKNITVRGRAQLPCPPTDDNEARVTYEWTTVPGGLVLSREAVLILPADSLDPGVYTYRFAATQVATSISAVEEVTITVTDQPLQVIMSGGNLRVNLRKKKEYATVPLSAYVIDYDAGPADFSWDCEVIYRGKEKEHKKDKEKKEKETCSKAFKDLVLPSPASGQRTEYNMSLEHVKQSYVRWTVTATKGSRTGSAYQDLSIVWDDNVPLVTIDAQDPGASGQHDITLVPRVVSLLSEDAESQIAYWRWWLDSGSLNGAEAYADEQLDRNYPASCQQPKTSKGRKTREKGDVEPCIIPVDRRLAEGNNTLGAGTAQVITIFEDALRRSTQYKLTVYAVDHAGNTAKAWYEFVSSPGTSAGACAVTPATGTAFSTDFQIACTNWEGVAPLEYRFLYREVGAGDEQVISDWSASNYVDELRFPGPVEITAEIRGATGTVVLKHPVVTVTTADPPAPALIKGQLKRCKQLGLFTRDDQGFAQALQYSVLSLSALSHARRRSGLVNTSDPAYQERVAVREEALALVESFNNGVLGLTGGDVALRVNTLQAAVGDGLEVSANASVSAFSALLSLLQGNEFPRAALQASVLTMGRLQQSAGVFPPGDAATLNTCIGLVQAKLLDQLQCGQSHNLADALSIVNLAVNVKSRCQSTVNAWEHAYPSGGASFTGTSYRIPPAVQGPRGVPVVIVSSTSLDPVVDGGPLVAATLDIRALTWDGDNSSWVSAAIARVAPFTPMQARPSNLDGALQDPNEINANNGVKVVLPAVHPHSRQAMLSAQTAAANPSYIPRCVRRASPMAGEEAWSTAGCRLTSTSAGVIRLMIAGEAWHPENDRELSLPVYVIRVGGVKIGEGRVTWALETPDSVDLEEGFQTLEWRAVDVPAVFPRGERTLEVEFMNPAADKLGTAAQRTLWVRSVSTGGQTVAWTEKGSGLVKAYAIGDDGERKDVDFTGRISDRGVMTLTLPGTTPTIESYTCVCEEAGQLSVSLLAASADPPSSVDIASGEVDSFIAVIAAVFVVCLGLICCCFVCIVSACYQKHVKKEENVLDFEGSIFDVLFSEDKSAILLAGVSILTFVAAVITGALLSASYERYNQGGGEAVCEPVPQVQCTATGSEDQKVLEVAQSLNFMVFIVGPIFLLIDNIINVVASGLRNERGIHLGPIISLIDLVVNVVMFVILAVIGLFVDPPICDLYFPTKLARDSCSVMNDLMVVLGVVLMLSCAWALGLFISGVQRRVEHTAYLASRARHRHKRGHKTAIAAESEEEMTEE